MKKRGDKMEILAIILASIALFWIIYTITITPIKKDLREIKEKLNQLTQKTEEKSKDE